MKSVAMPLTIDAIIDKGRPPICEGCDDPLWVCPCGEETCHDSCPHCGTERPLEEFHFVDRAGCSFDGGCCQTVEEAKAYAKTHHLLIFRVMGDEEPLYPV